jgi:hypothetical protein
MQGGKKEVPFMLEAQTLLTAVQTTVLDRPAPMAGGGLELAQGWHPKHSQKKLPVQQRPQSLPS